MGKDLLKHLSEKIEPKKASTLNLLASMLTVKNRYIKDHEESLKVGRANVNEFGEAGIKVLRNKLSVANKEKLEIIACIKWVKSIK